MSQKKAQKEKNLEKGINKLVANGENFIEQLYSLQKEFQSFKNADNPDFLDDTKFGEVSTISIFEALIYTSCHLEEDFELVVRSILYPCVYERVFSQDEQYFLHKMPENPPKTLQRLLGEVRKDITSNLLSPDNFDKAQRLMESAIKEEFLVEVYGDKDPRWREDQCYDFQKMKVYYQEDPTILPLIFDGLDSYQQRKLKVSLQNGVISYVSSYNRSVK